MNTTQLIADIFDLMRDPLEYIFLALKYKKIPTCLAKYIIITHFMPNYKIKYENILTRAPKSIPYVFNKYIQISTAVRKSYFKISKTFDADIEVNNFRFNMPSSIFSKKFIMNFLNVIPLKMQFRYRLTDGLKIPSIPLHLQKKFNRYCHSNFSKVHHIISVKNKIHKHSEKLKKYNNLFNNLNFL